MIKVLRSIFRFWNLFLMIVLITWLMVLIGLHIRLQLLSVAEPAQGVVVGQKVHPPKDRRRHDVFSPTVRFQDRHGESVTFTTQWFRDEPFEKGTPLPVIYDPQDPSNAEVNQFRPLWEGQIIVSIVAIILAAAAILCRKEAAREKRAIMQKSK